MSSSSNDEFEDPYNNISSEEAIGPLEVENTYKAAGGEGGPPGAAEVVVCSR